LKVLLTKRFTSTRIRCHGDYHLGQILCTGKDFIFIDFEGEPSRSLSTRRLKQSPLKDVAGMLRSFHYAIRTGLQKFLARELPSPDIAPLANQWAEIWYKLTSEIFLQAYIERTKDIQSFPKPGEEFNTLLNIFMLEKAIYELNYELNHRPEWVHIPLDGILKIMAQKEVGDGK
jgi:maltose alpha-D-glucosyltransferase/alpha-amylase